MDTKLLQPGDVILFSGKGFISRGIKWFSNSRWSHVGLYVGGGGGYIIEATEAGVEKTALAPLVAKAQAVCVRRRAGLTVEQVEQIKDKAYGLIYDGYDFVQLLSLGIYFAFRKLGITWSALVRNSRNRMICSELVAVCFSVLPIRFRAKTKLVTPEDLYVTKELDTVYEEVIK